MKNRLMISAMGSLAAMLLASIVSCSDKSEKYDSSMVIDIQENAPGDSTIYGLACDGCTDSVIVFLPYKGGDPDTIDILAAKKQGKVFGKPTIGDKLAVILNADDKKEASMVIDIEDLLGQWCYMAMPHFRDISNLPARLQRRILAQIPDTMKESLLVPREFGINIKNGFSATPIGMMRKSNTTDDQSPVEYPPLRVYNEWRLYNGHLLLVRTAKMRQMGNDSIKKPADIIDTASIVMLGPDTLILKVGNENLNYYRKKQ